MSWHCATWISGYNLQGLSAAKSAQSIAGHIMATKRMQKPCSRGLAGETPQKLH